ncbi:MAG TPA: hypothetical protein VFF73_12550 [Planctomycetota bacterium]|nr:hypothetical protein [Planctomycetota bacterium]
MKRATLVLVLSFLGGVVVAEDLGPAKEERKLSDEYKTFERRLDEAFNAWRRIDPKKAERMERALAASRAAFEGKDGAPEAIWEKMRSVVALLDEPGAQTALVAEKEILEALEKVLASLLEDEPEKARNNDSRKLGPLHEEAERILRRQREHMEGLPKDSGELQRIGQATRELGKEIEKARAPGTRQIDRALDEQQRAGDDLANRHVDDAREKEKDAVRDLEELSAELRRALIQARKREQEAVLASLGQRFQKMLEKQRDLSRRTGTLAAERTDELNRKQRLECTALSSGERELREDADGAIALVREEGSSANLPSILGDLRDDLGRLSDLLDRRDTSKFVRTVQKDVEKTLEELIEAMRKEIEERAFRKDDDRDGPEDRNGEKLLPATAELKLIRAQQIRVNAETREAEAAEDRTGACRMVAEKQARVASLVRGLEASLNR